MAKKDKELTEWTVEDYLAPELTSAWDLHYSDELETRKYGKGFNNKIFEVYDWVYEHRDIIWDTPFEEQERMMIEDDEEQEESSAGMTVEEYLASELTSAWDLHYSDELETRKYGKGFNNKIFEVYDWVYEHRDIIWDTPFEEQERMMIEDGVLTPDDL